MPNNQVLVCLDREVVLPRYRRFKKRYPKLNDSQIINAAILFYLSHPERGQFGKAMETVLASGPRRAELWTEAQRRLYRREHRSDKA